MYWEYIKFTTTKNKYFVYLFENFFFNIFRLFGINILQNVLNMINFFDFYSITKYSKFALKFFPWMCVFKKVASFAQDNKRISHITIKMIKESWIFIKKILTPKIQ